MATTELLERVANDADKPTPKRPTAAVLALALVAALVLTGGFLWWKHKPLPDDAAFAVGDQVVTVDELDRRVELLRALYGVQPPEGDRLDDFRKDSAKSFAVYLVLAEKAEDMNIGIAETTVRRTLENYLNDQLGPGQNTRDEFVRILGNVGVSEDEVLDEVRQQLTVSRLFEEVTGDIGIDDGEVRDAYDRFGDRLGTTERRQLRNIVVTTRDRAAQLLEQARQGTSFAKLARRFSVDGSTRAAGGDLGLVSEDRLEEAYAEAAFAAPAGGRFGPVQTQHGWNVGQVGEIRPAERPAFGQVEENVHRLALFEKRLDAWKQWLREALKDADVRYADDYRPDDPFAVPTNAQPSAPPVQEGAR